MNQPSIEPLTDIQRLQKSARLAMHVWEMPQIPGTFYDPLFEQLHRLKAEDIPASLLAGGRSLLSMSLVPPGGADDHTKSMSPWESLSKVPHAGYLFSLDQSVPHSARVITASINNLGSGTVTTKKKIVRFKAPKAKDDDVLLKAYYRTRGIGDAPVAEIKGNDQVPTSKRNEEKFEEDQRAYLAFITPHAAGADGREYSGKQLDIMARYYHEQPRSLLPWKHEDRSHVPHNEIFVAASWPHVQAIFVPDIGSKKDHRPVRLTSMIALKGALAGLEHLDRGEDLPVVVYHVHTHDGIAAGSFTFLGQGKEHLTTVLAEAWEALQRSPGTDKSELEDAITRYIQSDDVKTLVESRLTQRAHVCSQDNDSAFRVDTIKALGTLDPSPTRRIVHG